MIIGIVGFAGSGKGSVADILVNDHGFHKVSFADAVKDATSAIFGWPRYLLEGDTDESREFRECADSWWTDKLGYKMTPRRALQMMGTEAGRNVFGEDLWVLAMRNRLHHMTLTNIVIPDCRFPNEIDAIHDTGGLVLRVKRGEEPEWWHDAFDANKTGDYGLMEEYGVHFSEWAWIGSDIDRYIQNEGTLDDLKKNVDEVLKSFAFTNT